jgi:hypothetical protein
VGLILKARAALAWIHEARWGEERKELKARITSSRREG